MNPKQHYRQMWERAYALFGKGQFEYDDLIHHPNDTRRGITLLARPSDPVKKRILAMLDDFRSGEPQQYYYAASDIHLTVLSIISCHPDFSLTQINVNAYIELIRAALTSYPSFSVRFSGLTASPSCLLVQGFPLSDTLENIRDDLREQFKNVSLLHSIDKRYPIQTAHATVVRFCAPLADVGLFLQKVRAYRTVDSGVFEINELELVFNDWYQRAANTIVLEKFKLNS